jgi:hypothetical protein
MLVDQQRAALISRLRSDFIYLSMGKAAWSAAVSTVAARLRESGLRAVVFGGCLRSLVLARQGRAGLGRPRDVDIVVDCDEVGQIEATLRHLPFRRNRFGGLHVEHQGWQFDLWPLRQTWAFRGAGIRSTGFAALPETTFFNLEALALEVWAPRRHFRRIYCGDGQFFDGVLGRVLEVNVEENPFPALCLARTFVFANSTGFRVGPRLRDYLRAHSGLARTAEFLRAQESHYGCVRVTTEVFLRWVEELDSTDDFRPHAGHVAIRSNGGARNARGALP